MIRTLTYEQVDNLDTSLMSSAMWNVICRAKAHETFKVGCAVTYDENNLRGAIIVSEPFDPAEQVAHVVWPSHR